MDYYERKNQKSLETFKLSLKWLAYFIIFYTLYNISVIIFLLCVVILLVNKIFNLHIMCRLFGHIANDITRDNIVRCQRCNHPLYRIKKY